MKLIKRSSLVYQEGSSDKVYEIDLCQTGEDRYVVNFRYGRRGTNLKEGVKTVQALLLAEAQRAFDKLVSEKVRKGYRDVSTQPIDVQSESSVAPSNVPVSADPRHQAILNRLANQSNSKWPLERAIWRAGELKICEATPLLISLIGTGEPLRDYCIAWALGWCGGESAIALLVSLYTNSSTPEFVKRIAFEALLKADEQTRTALRSEKVAQLPSELRNLARNGTAEVFSQALRTYLEGGYQCFAVLDTIYQIDNEYVRPALLDILLTAPFKPNYFKQIRHIFKIAEYRRDAEVFAIVASRLETQKAMFRSDSYYVRLPDGGSLSQYVYENYNPRSRRYETVRNQVAEEQSKPSSRVAYSTNTREYLLRRVWRTLKQLGEENDVEYVKMAVSILLKYADADAVPVRETTVSRWERSNWTRISFTHNWDAYAGYLTFNHILYENSPRYELKLNSKAWVCRNSYKPGDPEPDVREEAFPKLWQHHPTALLQLLIESNCHPVHHFAVKALRVCQQFCAELDLGTLIKLVNKPYEVTAELGFELARERYNSANPNLELIIALANCFFPPARTQAYQWIEVQRDRFLESSNFIAALVTSQHADTRQFARRLLNSSVLSDATARVLIGRIIAHLLALESEELGIVEDIGETLLINFTPQLRSLGFGIILDLLQHLIPEVQELGARILLNHETSAADLPPNLIESLIASPYESVRSIGIRIFGQLPDETLIGSQRVLITAMAVSVIADIRNSIQPIIQRLGTENSAFATELAADFIEVLLIPERHEGVHSYLVSLLRELPGWMSDTTKETALRLLRGNFPAAQELGGVVLSANCDRWSSEFETSEIVKLANHEILSVREAARQMFLQILDRFRTDSQEMLAAVRLLEAKWEDSREFAVHTFTTSFAGEDFTPSVLVNICDSIREDVRQFGRDLVTRNFKAADGQDYLLKFSEHPSADMQLFASNYLENYATNNPDRLQELAPYFISVLCRVNKGRVAKQRIFAFLDAEAEKSEAAARVVAEILTRQSLTVAIADKEIAIQTMLKIHKTYPHLSLPIAVKPVLEVRR